MKKPLPFNSDYNRDPNIKALKRSFFLSRVYIQRFSGQASGA